MSAAVEMSPAVASRPVVRTGVRRTIAHVWFPAALLPALFSGTTINLGIATYFSNGGGVMGSATNGATCPSTAQNNVP